MINKQAEKIAEKHDYTTWNTGGGCEAFMKCLRCVDGRDEYFLITDASGGDCDADPKDEDWIVGIYNDDSWINFNMTFTLKGAIDTLADLTTFAPPDSDVWEKTYDDIDAYKEAVKGESK